MRRPLSLSLRPCRNRHVLAMSPDPRHVLYCLMVAGTYAPRAFGCPADKPHKICRALGLTMSAAMAWKVVNGDPRYNILETVEPFWTAPDDDRMVVLSALRLAPVPGVWHCISVADDLLAKWLAHTRAGRFPEAVAISRHVLDLWALLEIGSAASASPATSSPHTPRPAPSLPPPPQCLPLPW